MATGVRVFVVVICLCSLSCKDRGSMPSSGATPSIRSDAELFTHITQTEPFRGYTLFPHADSVTSGTLNGSTAHQSLVRVSVNSVAAGALVNGRYNTPFPNGSIIHKEIRDGSGQTVLFAVLFKDASNPSAGNGWLWAEYLPDGTPFISMTARGANCISCHSREQGPQHDFVRTFERQR